MTRWLTCAALIVAAVLVVPPGLITDLERAIKGTSTAAETNVPVGKPATRREIRTLLRHLEVRPPQDRPGYDRDCGIGHACVFNPPLLHLMHQ